MAGTNGSPPKNPPAKKNQGHKSPPGRKSKKNCKSSAVPHGWHLRCLQFQGGFGGVEAVKSDLGTDAHTNNLAEGIANGTTDLPLYKTVTHRVSLSNGEPLLNLKNTHRRRMFIQVQDDGDEKEEAKLATLRAVKVFLDQSENNSYSTCPHQGAHLEHESQLAIPPQA